MSQGPSQTGLAKDATVGNRFAGGKRTTAVLATAAGDTTIYTPAAGKKLTLYWVGLSGSQNNAGETLVTVRLGAKVVYEWFIGNPGAFSHWELVPADNANDPLIVNLSAAESPGVTVNYTTTEA